MNLDANDDSDNNFLLFPECNDQLVYLKLNDATVER